MTVPIVQYFGLTSLSDPKFRRFFFIADMCLTIYLLLDPFVYVLQGYFEGRLKVKCCNKQSDSNVSLPSIIKTQNSEMSLTIPYSSRDSKPGDEFISMDRFSDC